MCKHPFKKIMEKIVKAKYLLWDCESSLYDAVELKSIQRQLNSAILSTRSLSMPRIIHRHCPVCTHATAPAPALSTRFSTSKIVPRTLQKFIRSFFKSKSSNNDNMTSFEFDGGSSYVINYQRFGALTTIPETPENLCNICINGGDDNRLKLENRSLIARSASYKFATAATGF